MVAKRVGLDMAAGGADRGGPMTDRYMAEAEKIWKLAQDYDYDLFIEAMRAHDECIRREVWIEAQKLSAQCGSRDHTEEAFKLRAWRGE